MEYMVKVSIIVPVYNAEKYLEQTIDALLNQSLEDIEIILVDDGSSDASAEICDHFVSQDQRVMCIHKNNAGVSAARNDGMQAATGEYLMFCDADDIPNHEQAELLYKKAMCEDADAVLCGFTRQHKGKDYLEPCPYRKSMDQREEILNCLVMPMCVWSFERYGQVYPKIYGSVCRGVYRRSIANSILFPTNIVLGEDMIFNIKFWMKCRKIAFVEDSLYYYRENNASATHSNSHLLWDRYINTWDMTHRTLYDIGAGSDNLKWHNYQLCRYATSAIVEGVCTADIGFLEKIRSAKKILNNLALANARKDIPKSISGKKRIIVKTQVPMLSWLWVIYYQLR